MTDPTAFSRSQEGESLEGLLDRLEEAPAGKAVSAGDLLMAMEGRSLGAIIATLGLLASMPLIGGIPGVSIGVATVILAALLQSVPGIGTDKGLWAPSFLRRREIGTETFRKGIEKSRPAAQRVDRHLRPRLTVLTRNTAGRVGLLVSASLLAVSMYPLAAVPWGVTPPALGITALGLAMMTRDGAAALVGYALAGATVATLIAVL